jgi:hypothetical protein
MQHGVLRPFGFHRIDSQPFEQLFAVIEVALQSTAVHGLTHQARTAQEDVTGSVGELIDMLRLVYVDGIGELTKNCEALNFKWKV